MVDETQLFVPKILQKIVVTALQQWRDCAQRAGSASPYNMTFGAYNPNQPIPHWIKNEAMFWIRGNISYEDNRQGIGYLFENGILRNPLN